MKFSTRNDREKSFVNPERAASKIWRRLACAMLCVVLLGSNLTVAFATEGTTLTENEPVVTEQTAEVPETTEPKVPETTEPKAPETSEPETPETTEPKAPETSEPETPETTEPKAPETSEPETPETTEPKVPETTVPETTVPETTVPETTVPETTVPETTVPEEEAVTYTLYLTHVFRFKVDGNRRSVQASEEITLTEADFVDGVCDISRFAQKAEQIQDTIANPVSISIKEFGANHKGGAQILYTVKSGWKVVRKGESTGEGTALRAVFQGKPDDYVFVPVKVLTLNLKFAYSKTGGLAGIDAASPVTVQLEPTETEGKYKVEYPLPTVTGFRIVLDPTALNRYVVSPPTGNETAAELKEKLENGAFNVDIVNHTIYYYQEPDNNGTETHPQYGNQYSTEYNQAWNTARTLTAEEYTATAVGDNNNQGANPLKNAKLEVTLTEDQLKNALENQLSITVYYRRNATWYTVNHWVPQTLAGGNTTGLETKEVEGTTYVRRDQETLQGRVGATTRAQAKVEGVYEELTPVGFTQKEIANTGTVVDIYYMAANSYRVIFDTSYTYIPRQQVELGNSVDFENVEEPQRTGYTFGGWRYLKKGATPNDKGEYAEADYEDAGTRDNPELIVNEELIARAKLQESGGVLALHLYPKWEPQETTVRIILWTEDLTGTDDVQAFATGGDTTYYNSKYTKYSEAPVTHAPQLGTSDPHYSNAGSFTVNVPTDSYLLDSTDSSKLLDSIQTEVDAKFRIAMDKASGLDVADFYTQAAFEIVHDTAGGTDYSTTTAAADGKTMIYVYFTRNIYELLFTYYGRATVGGNTSDYCVAVNTNGYSFSHGAAVPNGNLTFYYTPRHEGYSNGWMRADVTSPSDMPVPQTITIRGKYGADLRNVWPVARSEENVDSLDNSGNRGTTAKMISWGTTDGKYCEGGFFGSGEYNAGEPTIMGTYAAMSSEIVADPARPVVYKDGTFVNSGLRHNLVAYWFNGYISHYRNNHCFEIPELDVTGMEKVSIYGGQTENERNVLYLVPTNNETVAKYGFNDLMRVSYKDGQITYNDPDGDHYAVRAYNDSYYAVARQVDTVSSNSINKQNPSARLHMTRANNTPDHSTQWADTDGAYNGRVVGTQDAPYDLYFYYNRDRYTITYMVPSNAENATHTEYTLGTVTLPYGAQVTKEDYSFPLEQGDKNTNTKYGWTPATPEVSVCPDRAEYGTAKWTFKGWGLGPGGVNMQWPMNEDTETEVQAGESFAIESNLRLYAIWGSPTYTVTFHLDGGMVNNSPNDIPVEVPANTRYSASGSIPRPLRNGYTLVGWYTKNADGQEIAFDFDQTIAENKEVHARWTPVSEVKFDYTIYYVTDTPHEADKTKPTVRIADDKIVTDDTATKYYVLDKAKNENQMFIANSSLNFSATTQEGYVPRQTNKILTMVGDPEKDTYNVIFYYAPITPGQHMVRFVEAGTETGTKPNVVKEAQVNADQTVVTPKSDVAAELVNKGYALVNKNGDQYTAVNKADDLKWIDEDGKPQDTTTLKGDAIPGTITYLVQPIPYTVTYTNAAGSPAAAEAALTAVTAAKNTSVENADGKNPTLYTTKNTFTAKNPARVYEDGKWYKFDYWSLGTGTGVKDTPNYTDETLTVEPGTVGNLEFVANWEEVTDVGSLTVSKTVAGNAGDQAKDFNFRVTLSDTISGTFDGMTFTNGVAEFKLKHGERMTAAGLLSGLGYTVVETEADQDGYVTTETNDTGTIPAPNNAGETQTVEAAFTNTKNVGSLKITKTVEGGSDADNEKEFTFTVTLTDANNNRVSGTFGDKTFADGTTTVTAKHNQPVTLTGLPAGVTYTVSENEDTDFTVTYTGNTGTIPAPNNAGETQTAVAAFTNTRKAGSLTISKTVVGGSNADNEKEFTFTVTLTDANNNRVSGTFGGKTFADGTTTVTAKHNQPVTLTGLPAGVTYTVSENEDTDFTVSYGDASNTGTITADGIANVTVTNTRKAGSLTISKTVEGGSNADNEKEFTFTVTLTDANNNRVSGTFGGKTFADGTTTVTAKHNQPVTLTGLPVGVNYDVTEDEDTDFTVSYGDASNIGTITADGTAAVTVTNTRKAGSLTVSKNVVSGSNADKQKAFTFTVELADKTINKTYGRMVFINGVATFQLSDGDSITASGIPTGMGYTVTEEAANDYITDEPANAKGNIVENGATVTFTNTRKTGSLTVKKNVAGDAGERDRYFTFTVTLGDQTVTGTFGDMTFTNGTANISLKHGESKTATGLPAGITYTVTEVEANQNDYVTVATGNRGNIEDGQVKTAVFTNTKNKPLPPPNTHITISNTVTGNAGEKTRDFHFTLTLSDNTITGKYGDLKFTNGEATFTLKDGESLTAHQIPLRSEITYTVTETEANKDGYKTTATNATGALEANKTAAVTFVNERNQYGSLTVSKTVTGTSAETDRPFSFTVTLSDTSISGTYGDMSFTGGKATFTLKSGESKTAQNLPVGITYTVTEAETENYTSSATGAQGTIVKDQTQTAAFTNTRKTGDLTVSKKVAGTGAETDRPFSFTVTLSDTTINGTFGGMTFTDGKATFALKDGESKTAEKLPVGITYTVTETETEDYTVSATGEKGTITADQPMTAAFTNTKKEAPAPETGSLTVSKKVTGTGAETDRPFSFTVILGDTTISDTYGEMTFTDGKATFTLKDGESKTAEKLPVGVTYTVTEEETKDYTASSTGARGTVAKDQTLTAAFTNTKKETPAQETGSLTVSKKVTGTGAETDRPFSFTVTLSDTTISGVYGDMTFTDGKATFALKDGESKTAEKLPVGVTYTVTEEETKDYTASSTGAKGTIAKDQTLTAAFTNTKKEAPAPETGDLTVTKKVTGYKADKTKAFTFVVTLDDETINGQYGDMKFVDGRAEFTLKHGESKTAEDLPAGVAYTVKEGDNAGYAVTKTGDTGTIQARRNVYARFTNRKTNLDNYYQTGDETKLELWAGMAALCFLGAVVSLVISKKRKGKFSK